MRNWRLELEDKDRRRPWKSCVVPQNAVADENERKSKKSRRDGSESQADDKL